MLITPQLQERINLLSELSNITRVVVEDVPVSWKNLIDNVDSVLFKISKETKTIDLIVPKSICMSSSPAMSSASDIENLNRMINVLVDKVDFDHCIMCKSNEELESFYFLDPNDFLIKEIENVSVITNKTPDQQSLYNLLNELDFVRDVTFYYTLNNDSYALIGCNIFHTQSPTLTTRYKTLIPKHLFSDAELHSHIVEDLIKFSNTTITDIPEQITP
jgi:hypothetical protein